MKREEYRELIEQKTFDGRLYGFKRPNLPHISGSIVAEIENREVKSQKSKVLRPRVGKRRKGTLGKIVKNQKTSPHQERVEQPVDTSAQVLISISEIQRRVTPGKKERYFP